MATAVGPALDLDGPLPVAREYSLLATPGVLVPPGDERWLNGVNVYGYPAGLPLSWEPCSDGTLRVKSDTAVAREVDAQPGGRFDALALYFPLTCSVHGMRDPQRLASRIELALQATLSTGVEAVLAGGNSFSSNPFLGDTNMVALAGGAAVAPRIGLAYLENAIGELTGRAGLIHATPGTVAALGFNFLRHGGPGEILTAAGTLVAEGAGYIGIDPIGQAAHADTKDWAFATGPINAFVVDGVQLETVSAIDHSDDTIVFRAEKYVLVEWDLALQVGVLIDWSLA